MRAWLTIPLQGHVYLTRCELEIDPQRGRPAQVSIRTDPSAIRVALSLSASRGELFAIARTYSPRARRESSPTT